jgi:hypothetical protein
MPRHQTGTLEEHNGTCRARANVAGKRQTIDLGMGDRAEAQRRLAAIVAELEAVKVEKGKG